MTRTMLTTQLFAAAAMLLVTVGALPAAAQTFDAAVEAYERGDYATALAGFQNYAEQGTALAQLNLGLMYASGRGCAQGRRRGGAVVPPRCRAGLPPPRSSSSGSCTPTARAVPEDDAEAVRWFRLAAEQDNAAAQFNLGVMYASGERCARGGRRGGAVVPPRRRAGLRRRAVQARAQ